VTPPTPAMQSRQKRKLFDGQSPNPPTQHMGLTVWVGSWQMQCCGEPFSVGQPVSWMLGDADQDWLMTMLGADAQVTVDAAEEHHGGLSRGDAENHRNRHPHCGRSLPLRARRASTRKRSIPCPALVSRATSSRQTGGRLTMAICGSSAISSISRSDDPGGDQFECGICAIRGM
jgi:hypothetical protein